MWPWLLSALWGYVVGAVPTGVIITQLLGVEDVRFMGSGHTGASNVGRAAGIRVGIFTALVDIALGFSAVTVAVLTTGNSWVATVAGIAAVVGHDWSIFICFKGGIGLAKYGGGLIALWLWQPWVTVLFLMGLWFVLIKKLRFHRAWMTMLMMLFIPPLFGVLGCALPVIVQGVGCSLMVIIKTFPDGQRVYT